MRNCLHVNKRLLIDSSRTIMICTVSNNDPNGAIVGGSGKVNCSCIKLQSREDRMLHSACALFANTIASSNSFLWHTMWIHRICCIVEDPFCLWEDEIDCWKENEPTCGRLYLRFWYLHSTGMDRTAFTQFKY